MTSSDQLNVVDIATLAEQQSAMLRAKIASYLSAYQDIKFLAGDKLPGKLLHVLAKMIKQIDDGQQPTLGLLNVLPGSIKNSITQAATYGHIVKQTGILPGKLFDSMAESPDVCHEIISKLKEISNG